MATKGRKPIPKTQKELLVDQQVPYEQTGLGNPNLANGKNRGEHLSVKGDTTKPFSIGIQDIDESIFSSISRDEVQWW